MLVLSRQIGQSIVIDDQVVVTVERFTSDDLELSIQNVRGVPLGRVSLSRESTAALPRDVSVVMIQAGWDRVRMGFSYADQRTHICRKENWHDLHRPDR